ncbi:MAG: porin [Oceanospirillaceae bacterium]|nr:porin [Oceanospirillaceae bacterium]
MTTGSKLAVSVMMAVVSAQVSAVELGEFNGTTFAVDGYVKAEGVFIMPDDGDNSFEGSARQSRINFSMARTIGEHKTLAFIEGDFWDDSTEADSSYAWRLRHAYVSVDDVTVGQTWNGQFFATAPFDVGMINFFGSGTGGIAGNGAVVRPDLVLHYKLGGALFSLQDPAYSDADYPDLVASYTHRTESGHAFNVAVTGRDVETGNGDASEFGAALSVAGKLKFGNTDLSLSAFSGEGAGVYAGWGFNGARGTATSDVDESGDLITTTGFSAGIAHQFTDKLQGIVRYGQVEADEVAAGMDEDTLEMTNVTLIYNYLPKLELGLEWRDQNVANRPPSAASTSQRPAGSQVEVMARYRF